MANTKSAESTEQATVQFRGRGRDNEYRVLVGEKEIGRVVRVRDQKGNELGWKPKGARNFEPTARGKAAQALVKA